MFRFTQLNRFIARPVGQFVRMNSTNHKINTESFVFKYLQEGPKAVKFTSEHEWLALHEDDTGFLGITKYASEALGDATFIELPEVGDKFEAGESIGSVESVKSASEIYLPVGGEVVAINDVLESNPQLINEDPMGEGWIIQVKLNDPSLEGVELLSEEEYESSLHEA
ncbi:glycine cleavage system H-protein subunit [Yamadazyma tenuis]|uniref:Glycine cleavage system H protein n=1 Tax=Candida tenuis (strain ATCC 10573 / BCRC 21748 / CBS 615 / JCM 9827 / NBRC 10315 / NRRL Y-1498 / VKM Y-70) TaxID=590646 RepID=G3B5R3_CANTC|nr:glycine cleavage system H protein [Yamadazyma tenuis ATCC 10573]EGV63612.1 glycine cleavage system H protein [Yamadazyma tenuis ATCC 10573]WEJ96896.1 glycine cleavage system H-protein subunit [Yamadazyma tenuis]